MHVEARAFFSGPTWHTFAPAVDAPIRAEDLAMLFTGAVPYLRAFARVLPMATLVPALAMRGAPNSVRLALAFGLAMPIAGSFPQSTAPLGMTLALDVVLGLPLAILVATPLWMATHVGAIADLLRGAPEVTQAAPPATDGARGTLATLTALLAASAWVASGGVVRALALLATVTPAAGAAPFALAARALTDGLRLGVAASAGVIVAALVLEVALVAIGRAATPISPQPIATMARPIVSVLALAASLEGVRRLVG